jgi:hypothetical protein
VINYRRGTNCNPDKAEKMALDWSYPKETQWIYREVGTGLEPPVAVAKDMEGGQGKSFGSGKHKQLLLTGSGGSVSQLPYAPEGATGIN